MVKALCTAASHNGRREGNCNTPSPARNNNNNNASCQAGHNQSICWYLYCSALVKYSRYIYIYIKKNGKGGGGTAAVENETCEREKQLQIRMSNGALYRLVNMWEKANFEMEMNRL